MRRTAAAAVAALSLLPGMLAAAPTYAAGQPPAPAGSAAPDGKAGAASQALRQAESALRGGSSAAVRPDATLALRDLFVSVPALEGAERRRAELLLARPTQGRKDPRGDGYRAKSVKICNARLCVHRVKRTRDKATGTWARRTLRTMNRVWTAEVRDLGYRRPLRDGGRGGNGKLDVYLVDVGDEALYGYCAPEFTKPGSPRLASGYCVLDNDFARSQYGAAPQDSLEVSAAHEFFHAVQFAYDYLEDPWLMEATATWMEERVADSVNDNRRYLPQGQVKRPFVPLDWYNAAGTSQYGNWAFVEYLSERFGSSVVRTTWRKAGHGRGDGRDWSTRALQAALPARTSFADVYLGFLVANVRPALAYPEGEHWPEPVLSADSTLGPGQGLTSGKKGFRVRHMAGRMFRMRPAESLDSQRWRLRVRVNGPARKTGPRATVVRETGSGALRRTDVTLDRQGDGTLTVPFNRSQTGRVWVIVANTSTRFDCSGPYVVGYSCGGDPRDDRRTYRVRFETYQRG